MIAIAHNDWCPGKGVRELSRVAPRKLALLSLKKCTNCFRTIWRESGHKASRPPVSITENARRLLHAGEVLRLERIRFNPARIQLRRSSWHIRWA